MLAKGANYIEGGGRRVELDAAIALELRDVEYPLLESLPTGLEPPLKRDLNLVTSRLAIVRMLPIVNTKFVYLMEIQ